MRRFLLLAYGLLGLTLILSALAFIKASDKRSARIPASKALPASYR